MALVSLMTKYAIQKGKCPHSSAKNAEIFFIVMNHMKEPRFLNKFIEKRGFSQAVSSAYPLTIFWVTMSAISCVDSR